MVASLGARSGEAAAGGLRVLEVGCGTGHWLAALGEEGAPRSLDGVSVPLHRFGLDLSRGMLARAAGRDAQLHLVEGAAGQLPVAAHSLEFVSCVNALHQFAAPAHFLHQAARLLRSGGALAVVGIDPHDPHERADNFVYRYFPQAEGIDRARYPSHAQVAAWLGEAGLGAIERRLAGRAVNHQQGRAVLDFPFVQRHSSSTMALMSDEAHEAGLARLRAAVEEAEAAGEVPHFPYDLRFTIVVGQRVA